MVHASEDVHICSLDGRFEFIHRDFCVVCTLNGDHAVYASGVVWRLHRRAANGCANSGGQQ